MPKPKKAEAPALDIRKVEWRFGTLEVLGNDRPMGAALEQFGEWAQVEIEFLAQYFAPAATVLDIGGHVGAHAIAFASLAPHTIIHTFEPQPQLYKLLARNIKPFAGRIIGHRAALSARTTRAHLPVIEGEAPVDAGAFTMGPPGEQGVKVVVRALDSFDIENVDFIKLDIGGHEAEALAGAKNLIETNKPVVYCEVEKLEVAVDLLRLMKPWEYQTFYVATPAFNPENFAGSQDNFFGYANASGLLFVPRNGAPPEQRGATVLQRVETLDDLAPLLLATARIGDETAFDRNPIVLRRALASLHEAYAQLSGAQDDVEGAPEDAALEGETHEGAAATLETAQDEVDEAAHVEDEILEDEVLEEESGAADEAAVVEETSEPEARIALADIVDYHDDEELHESEEIASLGGEEDADAEEDAPDEGAPARDYTPLPADDELAELRQALRDERARAEGVLGMLEDIRDQYDLLYKRHKALTADLNDTREAKRIAEERAGILDSAAQTVWEDLSALQRSLDTAALLDTAAEGLPQTDDGEALQPAMTSTASATLGAIIEHMGIARAVPDDADEPATDEAASFEARLAEAEAALVTARHQHTQSRRQWLNERAEHEVTRGDLAAARARLAVVLKLIESADLPIARRSLTGRYLRRFGKGALAEALRALAKSKQFDARWYEKTYPDAARAPFAPIVQYLLRGGFEGRNPNPKFDSAAYLAAHSEVRAAGHNPLLHSVRWGAKRAQAKMPLPAAAEPPTITITPAAPEPAAPELAATDASEAPAPREATPDKPDSAAA